MKQSLKGWRIAILAADGFEKVELTVPEKALRLAGPRPTWCRCAAGEFAA